MTAYCPFLSKHGKFCRRILDKTSGPVSISSLETRCCILVAASSGRARKVSQALSGIVSSMISVSIVVKYVLSNLERSWDKACRKVSYASRRL